MSSTSFPLQGKVIAVAGASSGIGAKIATTLYGLGASICIGARRVERLEEVATECRSSTESPGKVVCCQLAVTTRESYFAFVQHACTEYGVESLDSIVNVAGVMFFHLMKNVKMDEWDMTLDVNCRGVLHCFGAVIPAMVKAGKGRIVVISSDAGVRDFQTLAVYCASKRFVETLTEVTRRELVGTGVSLTTIQPGDVKGTELVLKNTDEEAAAKYGVTIQKPVGEGSKRRQLVDTDDVANAVVYALTAPAHVSINSVLVEGIDQE